MQYLSSAKSLPKSQEQQSRTLERGQFSFLIVGAGRSGTSLLMGMLDEHPDLEVAMESFSMDCLMGYGLEVPAAKIKSDMANVRCQTFKEKCQTEAAKHPAKIWGNKITTEQIYGLEDHNSANGSDLPYLDLLFNQLLKGIKVIFLLRDGRTCVRSKIRRTGQSMEHACQRWKYSLHVMRFLQNHHKNNCVLRYENLVRNPITTLNTVCRFLSIPYNDVMLNGVSNVKIFPEYRNTRLRHDNLTLKGAPHLCTPLLLVELLDTGYINKLQFWFNRFRYSSYFIYALSTILVFVTVTLLVTGSK